MRHAARAAVRAAVLGAALASGGPAAAHGVGARALGPGAQTVEFYYATGEPMAYASVRLYAPRDGSGDAEVPFIDGRADKLGRFAFLPDAPGAWTARAEDGEGHKVSITVQADAVGGAAAPTGGLLSPFRLTLWASLSLNLLLASYWLSARRPARRPAPAE